MKQFFSRYLLAAGLVVLAAGGAKAGSCGHGGCGVGGVGYGDDGYGGYGVNWAWIYPRGGFTLYPGEPGSCVPSHSDYSKVNWLVPPTVSAQGTLDKLRELGIPQVRPDTIYLGKNPYAAGEAKLPLPNGWTPKEVEPKPADPKAKAPEKLDVKPKAEDKAPGEKTPADDE
jgi:hypothetical protein